MAVIHRPLVCLVITCLATAAPAGPAAAETEAMSPPAEFGLDAALLHETSAALASQHSRLMAATDVFGLYSAPALRPAPLGDPLSSAGAPAGDGGAALGSYPDAARGFEAPAGAASAGGVPGVFPGPFGDFDDPAATVDGGVLGPDQGLTHVLSTDESKGVVDDGADYQGDEPSTDDAKPELEVKEGLYATAAKVLTIDEEQMPVEGPGVPAALTASHGAAPPGRAQALTARETHVLCLLPDPSRHFTAGAAVPKDEYAPRAPPAHTGGAAESGDKYPIDAVITGGGAHAAAARTSDAAPAAPGVPAERPQLPAAAGDTGGPPPQLLPADLMTDEAVAMPLFYQNEFGQIISLSQHSAPAADGRPAAGQHWNQPWSAAGAVPNGVPMPGRGRVMFDPYTGRPLYPAAESGGTPVTMTDPATSGLYSGQSQSSGNAEGGTSAQVGSPTFLASYPRQPQYPSAQSPMAGSPGFHPSQYTPPAGATAWGQPAAAWSGDSPWPYDDRSPLSPAHRRTAHPAPWAGPGRPPAGAGQWPWPALSTQSRGRPAPVPSSGVFPLYSGWQPGQRAASPPAAGRFPLHSQWYRPAVVPLPGGGSVWPSRARWPRPATATATSEESGASSPPLGAGWPWPGVSMISSDGDALVVTGVGRSSGAMARAAGENGWPPVAIATAGGSAAGGSFSRASSGGFDLVFHDGMFSTGPMALRMSPEERVRSVTPPEERVEPDTPPTGNDEADTAPPPGDGVGEEDGTGEEQAEGSGELTEEEAGGDATT